MRLLHEDLLNPLPESNSRGEDLRYTPVYDKIKEARQEDEDDSPQGEWQRQRKKADPASVMKLAGDALIRKSKDLQLAAWFSEALLRREGFAALPQCVELFHELQLRFWEILYPQLEDGSPEFRATPQQWFASRCDYLLRRIPMAGKSFDWLKFKESRSVPYENNLRDDKDRARREEAIAEGKALPEEFDSAFNNTPRSFYDAASAHLDAALEGLASLEAFCDEKYGDVAPNFGRMRNAIKEMKQAIDALLKIKKELEPEPARAIDMEAMARKDTPSASLAPAIETLSQGPGQAEAPQEDAFAIIGRLAEQLRGQDESSVAAYLLARSARWGELRSAGDSLDHALLTPPSSEVRQNLKRLIIDCNWKELLQATEAAVISPCGRAWLDLQRYAWTACSQLGYSAAARAICSELRALLHDYPALSCSALSDDTPAANPETRVWIEENILAPRAAEPPVVQMASAPEIVNGHADHFQEAAEMARSGRMAEAMELLGRRNGTDDSGRERFLRRLKIARLCLSTGHFAIAYPILQELFAEIQRRELLDWEGAGFIAEPLKLLVHCIDKTSQDAQERAKVYNLLCCLEPGAALQLQR